MDKKLFSFCVFLAFLISIPIVVSDKATVNSEESGSQLGEEQVLGTSCDMVANSDINCDGKIGPIDFVHWLDIYRGNRPTSTPGECPNGCPAGQTCCQTGCVDLTSDSRNCGKCGYICPESTVCNSGSCVSLLPTLSEPTPSQECSPSCALGLTCCSGQCVNLTTDSKNCSKCDYVCPKLTYCVQGLCVPGSQTSCTTDSDCSALGDECNVYRCGSSGVCERVTLSNGISCNGGKCLFGVCCTGCIDAANICRPGNTVTRCGDDGEKCDICSTDETCMENSCIPLTCNNGTMSNGTCVCNTAYGDCDGNTLNGCETRIDTDSDCGACSMSCEEGQSCINGTCQSPNGEPV